MGCLISGKGHLRARISKSMLYIWPLLVIVSDGQQLHVGQLYSFAFYRDNFIKGIIGKSAESTVSLTEYRQWPKIDHYAAYIPWICLFDYNSMC